MATSLPETMINFPKFQGHEKVTKKSGMSTGDPMILTLRVPPLATEQGLCDIDRISFRVTQKNLKKMGSPGVAC